MSRTGLSITLSLCALLGFLSSRCAATTVSLPQGPRVALVIGNSHYGGTDDVSGIEDARQMKAALQKIGFEEADVTFVPDGTRQEIQTALDNFGADIEKASVVVFFFSGHGFQLGVENYLMPVDSSVAPASLIPLSLIKRKLSRAPSDAIKLVFLDACRQFKDLGDGQPQGLRAEQAPSSPRTLYAFAAGPNATTPAGQPHEVSAYTGILLHYLKEPGTTITQLLDKVGSDSALAGRLPAYVVNGVPSDFYLRDPVFVRAEVGPVNGNLLVVLNGEILFTFKKEDDRTPVKLPLRNGHNELRILMATGKAYDNGHTWESTEGWSYELKIGPDSAPTITCSGPDANGFCFDGGEDHPFKDGPHHGGAFVVAKATLVVDGADQVPRLTLEDSDNTAWKTTPPIWARDQELLYEKNVTSLNLTSADILSGLQIPPPWPDLLKPLVQELLTSGKLLGMKVADPGRTFVTVWGNKILGPAVATCMTGHEAQRRTDLRASLSAAFARKPRPFDGFDQGLTDCLRSESGSLPLKQDEIRIWTAIQDRSTGS